MNYDSKTGRPENRPVGTIVYQAVSAFLPEMPPEQVNTLSVLALAHIGDGVYELMMRTALAQAGVTAAQIDALLGMDGVRFAGCFNAVEKR